MVYRRTISVMAAVALLASLLLTQIAVVAADSPKILDFDRMVGIPSALTGTQAPIRGVNGGGLPWELTDAKGKLLADGDLRIKVTGLVLAAGANAGSNPIGSFRAVVSCLDANGATVNVTSDPFPATTGPASSGGGNADIRAALTLPNPCIAPIVFVTSPTGAWFAATGG